MMSREVWALLQSAICCFVVFKLTLHDPEDMFPCTANRRLAMIGQPLSFNWKACRTPQIIPVQMRIREDGTARMPVRPAKHEAGHTPVVKAAKEPAVIPGSCAFAEAIAQNMTQKSVVGSPLYCQKLGNTAYVLKQPILNACSGKKCYKEYKTWRGL